MNLEINVVHATNQDTTYIEMAFVKMKLWISNKKLT